jgi:hypothetical protein
MANHPEVRRQPIFRGIAVPSDTWFVGGYPDTRSDGVVLFDVAKVPVTHEPGLNAIRRSFDLMRAFSAHERTRRFASCDPRTDPAGALWHVEERSGQLAQPRPECGHFLPVATPMNAVSLFRLFSRIFLGTQRTGIHVVSDALPRERWVLSCIALFIVATGIVPGAVLALRRTAAQEVNSPLSSLEQHAR